MRIAVISDIHANFYALLAVLDDMARRDVDAVWCLGDMVGRGFQPAPVLGELRGLYLRQSAAHRRGWLCGNHDLILLGRSTMGWLEGDNLTAAGDNQYAIKTLQDNLAELEERPDLLNWLGSFQSHSRPHKHVFLAHAAYVLGEDGRVDEDNAYRIYLMHNSTIGDMLARLQHLGGVQAGLVMCGHTHISGAWRFIQTAEPTQDTDFDLRHELVYVNPGSVGFPRGDDQCPTYIILTVDDDFNRLGLEWAVVPYDIGNVNYPTGYPAVYQTEIARCGQY